MKKILLSAALFAAAITGVNAQCTAPTTATTNGFYMEYNKLYEDALFGGGNIELYNIKTTDPVDGYSNQIATVIDLKADVEYGVGSYGISDGTGRHLHHAKIFIDFNDNGDFSDSGEEVFVTDTAVPYMDGKNSNYSAYKEGFVLTAPVTGSHVMRIVSQKAAAADEANAITACGPYVDGNIFEVTVNVLDPNAVPPTAADDNALTVQDQAVIINIIANDSEGSSAILSGSVEVEPTNGTYVLNGDNSVTYTPNAGFRGVDGFTYKITNAVGSSEEAAVRVVVYGYKDVDGEQVLVIEDFDTMDETVGGILNDDDGYAWDGSFGWALNPPGGSKSDETSDVKAGAGAMLISINASAEAGIVMDDTHTGRKVDHSNVATKLQFSATDNNNVMGMWVMPYEIYTGMKFGFTLKRVEAFDADADGTPGNSYADSYISAYVDGADMTEWEFNFVGLDLASLEAEYKGAYVLHKLRYAFDMNASTSDFVIDEIGLYPANPLSNSNVELEGVTVYPNPVQNVLNIKAGRNTTVTVLNTIGSKIYEGESKTISTQSWKKGLYFVIVKEGNASKTVKVIK